jgi:hypothetical protein
MEQEKMSGKTLVLVTRPLGAHPGEMAKLALKSAARIIFLQDGVFNTPAIFSGETAYGMPGGHRAAFDTGAEVGIWPATCSAIEEDVKARRRRTAIKTIGYPELAQAIAAHEKIITL